MLSSVQFGYLLKIGIGKNIWTCLFIHFHIFTTSGQKIANGNTNNFDRMSDVMKIKSSRSLEVISRSLEFVRCFIFLQAIRWSNVIELW